jgi:uncharacterized protein with GYD domain
MSTYFMFGKYSPQALKNISATRTKNATKLVKKHGGKMSCMHALLGKNDLILITEFPTVEKAMKAAVALSKSTGIAFSTSPAVSVAEFDKMMSKA